MKDEFVTVPILEDFCAHRMIGELRIRVDALPAVPGFVFSIGFIALEETELWTGQGPRPPYTGRYQLMCVSPVKDESYLGYLRQVGKLP